MVKNYLLTAWRSFNKSIVQNTINIVGLSIALASCFIISTYVVHENSYDKFHKNENRIYSIYSRIKLGSDTVEFPLMNYTTGEIIARQSPAVEEYVRTNKPFKEAVVYNPDIPTIKFSEKKFIFADSNFFKFFSFPLSVGNLSEALTKPFSVVLTKSTAKKYFGAGNPIGKIVKYDSAYSFLVTGVADDPPSNSIFKFDFIASVTSLLSMKGSNLISAQQGISYGSFQTFFLLKKPDTHNSFRANIVRLLSKNQPTQGLQIVPYVISIRDIHLHSKFGATSNTKYLKIFPLIAVLILLLALVNYISLNSLTTIQRAKEIGLRRVIGSTKQKIAFQFFVESLIYLAAAAIIGLLIFFSVKTPLFKALQVEIDTAQIFNSRLLQFTLLIFLLITLISSLFPTIIFSTHKTTEILNGNLKKNSGLFLRKFSFVLQFLIAATVIISSIVINRQIHFIQSTETGIKRNDMLMIPFKTTLHGNYYALKQDIVNLHAIDNIATARFPLYNNLITLNASDKKTGADVPMSVYTTDDKFIPLLDLQWQINPGTSTVAEDEIIINEIAINKLNLDKNPIGQIINVGGESYRIKGVLQNFNYKSLESEIDAVAFFVKPDSLSEWGSKKDGCLFIRFSPNTNITELIKSVQSIYEKYDKNTPFNFIFPEDSYNAMYIAENRLSRIMYSFTSIATLLALLGLFGLVSFSANQRVKEMGIRRIMGANTISLIFLLINGFIKLVFISTLIAAPISWYFSNTWLQNFAYHIPLRSWIFIIPLFIILLLTSVISGMFSMKAVLSNPVKNLRVE